MKSIHNIISLIRKGYQRKDNFIKTTYQYNLQSKSFQEENLFIFLNILIKEGFIRGYRYCKELNQVTVYLKYESNGNQAITSITIISKESYRKCITTKVISQNRLGVGSTYVLSTILGLKTRHEARRLNLGGEVICTIR